MKFLPGRAAVLVAATGLVLALSVTLLSGSGPAAPISAVHRATAPSMLSDENPYRSHAHYLAPPSAFSHVFIIVMENREYGGIIGNPTAPYLNGLAQRYAIATNYFAVSHPSLPNYLALIAGSTFGIASDCTGCFVSATNIADQVEGSGRSWKAYMEDMPAPCFLGAWSGRYAQKHDPFVYFTDIRNNPARCAAHVVPFAQFSVDLAAGAVPDYVWITPNLCHDMHDCSTSTGDAWLRSVVPSILSSSAYQNNGVLFITWDEGYSRAGCCGASGGGHVATLVLSATSGSGLRSTIAENHYSLLRTIEDAWHLPDLGMAACRCTAQMREYFRAWSG